MAVDRPHARHAAPGTGARGRRTRKHRQMRTAASWAWMVAFSAVMLRDSVSNAPCNSLYASILLQSTACSIEVLGVCTSVCATFFTSGERPMVASTINLWCTCNSKERAHG